MASLANPTTPRMYLDRDGKVQTVAYRVPAGQEEARRANPLESDDAPDRVREGTPRRDAQGHGNDRRPSHRCAA